MKWYDDIRDELCIMGLAALGALALYWKVNEVAVAAAVGLAQFLKKERKNGLEPEYPPPQAATNNVFTEKEMEKINEVG